MGAIFEERECSAEADGHEMELPEDVTRFEHSSSVKK